MHRKECRPGPKPGAAVTAGRYYEQEQNQITGTTQEVHELADHPDVSSRCDEHCRVLRKPEGRSDRDDVCGDLYRCSRAFVLP